jgi:FkbM family methyltransferase
VTKSALLQRLARIPYPIGAVRSVVRGPLKGMRFTVVPGMGASYALGSDSYHFRWFSSRLRPGMTVYDVGANRGQMALYFARAVGSAGTVIAFEPVPRLFDALVANLRLNSLTNVSPHRLGVARSRGRAQFLFNEQSPTQGKLLHCEPSYLDPAAAACTVDTTSLDEFVGEGAGPAPDLLKIDVEGAAGLVLRGAARTLAKHSPAVYVELHGPEERLAVKECLVSQGYRAVTLRGEPVDDPTGGWHGPLWCTS